MTSNFGPYKRAAFLKPTDEAAHHLFAVMNDPCVARLCLIVNISSIGSRVHDPACILDVGDHPFIRHRSYVVYRLAETIHAIRYTQFVAKGIYIPRDDWAPAIFAKIAAGLHQSGDVPKRIFVCAEKNGIH